MVDLTTRNLEILMSQPRCPICSQLLDVKDPEWVFPEFATLLHPFGLSSRIVEVGFAMCKRCDVGRFGEFAHPVLASLVKLLPAELNDKVYDGLLQFVNRNRSVTVGHFRATGDIFVQSEPPAATITTWLSQEAIFFRVVIGSKLAFDLRVRNKSIVSSSPPTRPVWTFPERATQVWSPVFGVYLFDACIPLTFPKAARRGRRSTKRLKRLVRPTCGRLPLP